MRRGVHCAMQHWTDRAPAAKWESTFAAADGATPILADRNPERPDARPLYVQVDAILTSRIADGAWPPGHALPAEPELAQEMGVSHGTVRKALEGLERRHLIERHQGRGTFVAEQTSERALFHFFRIRTRDGRKVVPTSLAVSREDGPARPEEAAALRLAPGGAVHRLSRLRLLDGAARILEEIVLPAALYPGFAMPLGREMADELYVHLQRRHGVTVVRAQEALSAAAAGPRQAEALGVAEGTPLLAVERLAWDAAERVVERRVWWLDSAEHRYVTALD